MYRKGQYTRIFQHDIDLTIQTGRYLLPNCYFQHHYGDNHRRAAIHHDAECPVGLAQACKDIVLLLFTYQVLQYFQYFLGRDNCYWLTQNSIVGLGITHLALIPSFVHSTDVSCSSFPTPLPNPTLRRSFTYTDTLKRGNH